MEDLRKKLELHSGSCYDASRTNNLGRAMGGAQERADTRAEIRAKLPSGHSKAIRALVDTFGLSQAEILARALEHGLPMVRETLERMATTTNAD